MNTTVKIITLSAAILLPVSAAAMAYYSPPDSKPRKHREPPVQVVYRFDDHRYLELKGYDCEGELWYIDTRRKIRSQVSPQFYRIFTKKYIHPSERYIAIPSWGTGDSHSTGSFTVSRDYGRTWNYGFGHYAANINLKKRGEVVSFTVVNDQGFLLDDKGQIYFSSKPFEDPRILPGGPGIPFQLSDGSKDIIEPGASGAGWGLVYVDFELLTHYTGAYKINFQNIPNKVPEVKNYTGWDHMVCDWDAGREQEK